MKYLPASLISLVLAALRARAWDWQEEGLWRRWDDSLGLLERDILDDGWYKDSMLEIRDADIWDDMEAGAELMNRDVFDAMRLAYTTQQEQKAKKDKEKVVDDEKEKDSKDEKEKTDSSDLSGETTNAEKEAIVERLFKMIVSANVKAEEVAEDDMDDEILEASTETERADIVEKLFRIIVSTNLELDKVNKEISKVKEDKPDSRKDEKKDKKDDKPKEKTDKKKDDQKPDDKKDHPPPADHPSQSSLYSLKDHDDHHDPMDGQYNQLDAIDSSQELEDARAGAGADDPGPIADPGSAEDSAGDSGGDSGE